MTRTCFASNAPLLQLKVLENKHAFINLKAVVQVKSFSYPLG